MTNAQRIALRLSEVRQRLNTISGLDDLTDEMREESKGLATEYRDYLHATVAPLARGVERELTAKLEAEIGLNFDGLFAADLSGRARAFQSLTGGGMDVAKAAALAGLMDGE